jgi:hypothetical protein
MNQSPGMHRIKKKYILNNSKHPIPSRLYYMNILMHKTFYVVLLLLDWVQGIVCQAMALTCPW